jgi:hypothetical protein
MVLHIKISYCTAYQKQKQFVLVITKYALVLYGQYQKNEEDTYLILWAFIDCIFRYTQ